MHEFLQRRRDRRRAGRSGLRLYDDDLSTWRRERRGFFWSLTTVVTLVVATAAAIVVYDRHVVPWSAGFVAGMAIAFLVVVRSTGPHWIENRRIGAWAEQRTAAALADLSRHGWVVLHDLPRDRGNFDHVVIGPGGVFVLDTKQRAGVVSVDGDGLVVASPSGGRPRREDHHGASARAQGRELKRRLCDSGAPRLWVDAVVVVWGEFPERVVRGDSVTFVAGDALVAWLEDQQPKYTRTQVGELEQVARRLTTPEKDAHIRAA